MGYVKFNTGKKGNCLSKVSSATPEISNTDTKITNFESTAKTISNSWVDKFKEDVTDYDKTITNPDGTTSKQYDYSTANRAGSTHYSHADAVAANENYIKNDVEQYRNLAASAKSECTEVTSDANTRLTAIQTLLNALQGAVDAFEGSTADISFEAVIEALSDSGLGDNIDIQSITLEDGSTVDVVYYIDGDGNKFTISEMVNAFFTYTGTAVSGRIANEFILDKLGITDPDEIAKYNENYIAGIGNNVYQLLGKGFFSVATESNIDAMYQAAVPGGDITADYENLLKGTLLKGADGTEYTADDIFDANGVASVISGGVATAIGIGYTMSNEGDVSSMYSDDNTAAMEERQTKAAEKAEELKEEEPTEVDTEADTEPDTEADSEAEIEPDTTPATTPTTDTPKWSDTPTSGGSPSSPTTGGDGSGGDSSGGDTPSTPVAGDNDGDGLVDMVETELPTEPLEVEYTNEDIDAMARDEFYDRYSVPEDLAARRQQDIDAFTELYDSENRDALVEKFIEMGYDPAEALGAANNKDVGLAAYLLGSQNQELTQIAKDFANDLGLGDAFDTSYDDAPDYRDLFDGDAQVELTSPTTSQAIMSAKSEVTEAKTAYTEAVNNANQYIQDATKAKGELETIKASIESVSGTDSSKWTDAQVEQYNKATEAYNTAVTKANDEVAAAQEAKTAYTEAKDKLQKVEDEYYNEIRKAIQNQTGYADESGTNGTDSSGGTTSGTTGATTTEGTGNDSLAGTPLENGTTNSQDSDKSLIDQLFVNM